MVDVHRQLHAKNYVKLFPKPTNRVKPTIPIVKRLLLTATLQFDDTAAAQMPVQS